MGTGRRVRERARRRTRNSRVAATAAVAATIAVITGGVAVAQVDRNPPTPAVTTSPSPAPPAPRRGADDPAVAVERPAEDVRVDDPHVVPGDARSDDRRVVLAAGRRRPRLPRGQRPRAGGLDLGVQRRGERPGRARDRAPGRHAHDFTVDSTGTGRIPELAKMAAGRL